MNDKEKLKAITKEFLNLFEIPDWQIQLFGDINAKIEKIPDDKIQKGIIILKRYI